MAIERLDAGQAALLASRQLGLQMGEEALFSLEGLAASVRRAASFLCPVTSRRLVQSVAGTLTGLTTDDKQIEEQVEDVVHALTSQGDLLELRVAGGEGDRSELFIAPPAYVELAGDWILLGIRPDGVPLVDDQLEALVRHEGTLRRLYGRDTSDGAELLKIQGLAELTAEHWLEAPREESADDLCRAYDERLNAVGSVGDMPGIRVLDPAAPVSHYRGRWRALRADDSGRFVGRRPQAFGNDLWCYTEVAQGAVKRLLDLPLGPGLTAGSDEAWRLQAAIDRVRGEPQCVRVCNEPSTGNDRLDLFGPVPSWAQRRLSLAGHSISRGPSALFSHEIAQHRVDEEVRFLQRMAFLSIEDQRG